MAMPYQKASIYITAAIILFFLLWVPEPSTGLARPELRRLAEGTAAPAAAKAGTAPASRREVFLYVTHIENDLVAANLERLQRDLGKSAVFLLLVDTRANGSYSGRWGREDRGSGSGGSENGSQVLLVSESDCKAADPWHETMHANVHTFIGLAAQALEQLDYDYLYYIEWDVWCHGSWARCLNFSSGAEDFQGVFMLSYHQGETEHKSWHRWRSIQGQLAAVPLQARWRGFFPVARFSKRFLQEVAAEFGRSSGYTEAYLPTLAAAHNFSFGAFPSSMLGSFSWKPQLSRSKLPAQEEDRLYHPVKK